ncbi:hypothetical protein [Stenotrophomonas mori]|uniref:Uncharacterized protein n=1 Tax=Stenotrophomonas mori TaxID=2871096 RepID=A0ABT0SGK0_9GAMM|nr:hypothetical protein [Stenotrophomonas mori]MCL7714444.1 hypothetical protein [Stenotrophomonas mori]
MLMLSGGWEFLGLIVQPFLCFFGGLFLLVRIFLRRSVSGSARFLFLLYSFSCIAQLSFTVRVMVRFFKWGGVRKFDYFSIWILWGSVCFLLGVLMFFMEKIGRKFEEREYFLLFFIFAVLPWIGLFFFD